MKKVFGFLRENSILIIGFVWFSYIGVITTVDLFVGDKEKVHKLEKVVLLQESLLKDKENDILRYKAMALNFHINSHMLEEELEECEAHTQCHIERLENCLNELR